MKDLYQNNKDFRDYVNHYCQHYNEGRNITVEEALEHELVRLYAEECTK